MAISCLSSCISIWAFKSVYGKSILLEVRPTNALISLRRCTTEQSHHWPSEAFVDPVLLNGSKANALTGRSTFTDWSESVLIGHSLESFAMRRLVSKLTFICCFDGLLRSRMKVRFYHTINQPDAMKKFDVPFSHKIYSYIRVPSYLSTCPTLSGE